MAFKELKINKCYETTADRTNLVESFYNPVLEQSKLYFRIAGFFSSTSLSVISKGIAGLVNNDGKMKLLISPELSNNDFEIISKSKQLTDSLDLFKNFDIEDHASDDYLKLFSWLLANNKIEIKVVVDKNSKTSLFHQKVGIFFDKDSDDVISFSGSINETAQAWLSNIEEFKVFKSWETGQNDYLISDLQKFNFYWNGDRQDIAEIYDIPDSLRNRIISIKPNDIYEVALMKKYKKDKSNKEVDLSLFDHQKNAVKMWLENDKRLMIEMATGTGKTRTAIGCMLEQLKTNEKTVYIVATPQNTLSRQWKDEIEDKHLNFDQSIIVDGSNTKWKTDLTVALNNVFLGIKKTAVLYTTHVLACSDDFINIIKRNKNGMKIMFVCDEVHAIGSNVQKRAMLNEYEYRVGLSATPERMFDETGTAQIREYFGSKTFEFTIYDALHTINPITGKPYLNEFCYIPRFVELNDDEMVRYKNLSKQIAVAMDEDEPDETKITNLKIKRANIVKNASNKLDCYQDILDELSRYEKITDCITFVSDEQIDDVMTICSQNKISKAKITEAESASKIMSHTQLTERQDIIRQFKEHLVQILIGIYCLDEGIDIPNARIAILMASSINPREYVQRIGRVIRYAPNKKVSVIYDLIVLTDNEAINLKEAKRALSIAENAKNKEEVIREFEKKGVNVQCLLTRK